MVTPRKHPEERLLKLAAFLLSQHEPLTFEEICDRLPGAYTGAADAMEKKWTRDKAALKQAGVPIRVIDSDPSLPKGYFVDLRSYYLPDLDLCREEAAVLWTAARAAVSMGALPWRTELQSALAKLRCVGEEPPPPGLPVPMVFPGPKAHASRELLETIGEALNRRKRLAMRYFSAARQQETEREVDVYGIAWRRGIWLFAGFCHLRNELRVFYVSRVREAHLNPSRPAEPDYEIPADFDIRAFSKQQPWEYRQGPRQEVEVRLRGPLAPLAASLLPGAEVRTDADGAVARVIVYDLDALVRHVLTFGSDAEILSPPGARQRIRQVLERVIANHGGQP